MWYDLTLVGKRLLESLRTIDTYGTDKHKPPYTDGRCLPGQIQASMNIDAAKLIQWFFCRISHDMNASSKMNDDSSTRKRTPPIGTIVNIANHKVFTTIGQLASGTGNAANRETTVYRGSTQGPADKTIGAGDY